MLDAIAGTIQNQQPRSIALGRGMLRDQLRRQLKIKIGGSHPREFQVSGPKIQAVVE